MNTLGNPVSFLFRHSTSSFKERVQLDLIDSFARSFVGMLWDQLRGKRVNILIDCMVKLYGPLGSSLSDSLRDGLSTSLFKRNLDLGAKLHLYTPELGGHGLLNKLLRNVEVGFRNASSRYYVHGAFAPLYDGLAVIRGAIVQKLGR